MCCHKDIPPLPSSEKTVLQKIRQAAFKTNSAHTVCDNKINNKLEASMKSVSYSKFVQSNVNEDMELFSRWNGW